MTNYYRGVEDQPYHLSVGAVLQNNDGLIAVHHFLKTRDVSESRKKISDFYTLMRGTIEPKETPEQTLIRELMEEFGAKAKIITYLGSLAAAIGPNRDIQKTTLYFLCLLEEMHEEWRASGDPEGDSVIEWHEPSFLIKKMQEQASRYEMEDLDESRVIERAIEAQQ